MKFHRFWLFGGLAALALAFAAPAPAEAQEDYPNRPIELVVPYGAGGGNDLTARVMAAVAADYLGQPIVIRLRPGAGSVLGLSEVARARPDGYTLGWPGPHSIVISAFEQVPLNVMEDLTPIAQMVEWQWFLVVPGDSPFDTLEEFVEHAKANPGDILMANSGNLAIGHLPNTGLFEGKIDLVPWGFPCVRIEGGAYTGRGRPDDSCEVGVPSGVNIANRRFVVDEVLGTVAVFCTFGAGTPGGGSGAPDTHLFRVEDGKLRYVHTLTHLLQADFRGGGGQAN